jgi:hypothetical protein
MQEFFEMLEHEFEAAPLFSELLQLLKFIDCEGTWLRLYWLDDKYKDELD